MNEIDYAPSDDSRQKRKDAVEAMQAVGVKLTKLSETQLKQLDLPESLYDAIMEAKRLTSNGAIRRQRQFIGRIMREVDADAIGARLKAMEGVSHQQIAKFHLVERWRDRLLADEAVIDELLEHYPQADIQRLRTLMRNAKREQQNAKPPKSSRELFAALRELMIETEF